MGNHSNDGKQAERLYGGRGRVKKRKRGREKEKRRKQRERERETTHLIKLEHRSLEAEPEGLPSSLFLLHVGIIDASPIKVTMLGRGVGVG